MSTMREVQLDVAMRVIILNLFNRLVKSDLGTARNIRGISDATGFDLRTAERLVDKKNAERQSKYEIELEKYSKAQIAGDTNKTRPVRPELLSWIEVQELEQPKTFTIDISYITWLRDELKEMNWNEVRWQSQSGEVKTEKLPISIDQQIILADLDDALAAAKSLETTKKNGN